MESRFLNLGHIQKLLEKQPYKLKEPADERPKRSRISELQILVVLKNRKEDVLQGVRQEGVFQLNLCIFVQTLLRKVALEDFAEEPDKALGHLEALLVQLIVDEAAAKVLRGL